MKKNSFILILSLLMSSCAVSHTATTSTQLSNDIFSIRFNGSSYNSAEQAFDYCLLKAAAITEEHNYNYFEVLQNNESTKLSSVSQYGASYMPSSHFTIKIYKTKPQTNSVIYEATFLKQSIKSKYKI